MPIKGVLLLAFFIGSLPVCLVRPFYGILLWIIIAFLNPQSSLFYWPAATVFPWAEVVAVPTLIGFAMSGSPWKNLRSSKVGWIMVLWIWFSITSVISTHSGTFIHHAEDTWYYWRFVSKILLMTAVMVAMMDTFERLRTFVLVMAGCFGFFVLKAIPFLIMTHGAYRLYGPEYSMIADNNDLGLALNMSLPLSFLMAQTESRAWVRRLFAFIFVATIPSIFFTYSRGALVGLITVATMMLLRSRRRLVVIPVIGVGIAFAVLFAPAAWKHRMDPTRSDAIDGSALSRLNAWSFSWNLAKDYPLAGGGFGTFTHTLFAKYAPNTQDLHGPHSVYFEILAEHGFIGLAFYVGLIVSCFLTVYRLARKAKARGDIQVLAYANMLGLSVIGFLTSGVFLGRAYFDFYFALVACLAALEKIASEGWAIADEEEAADEDEEEEELIGFNPFPQIEAAH